MDVTVYPAPPQPLSASEHSRLGQLSYPEPAAFGTNKLEGDTMFLNMQETGLDYVSNNQFRVPQPPQPLSKVTPPNPSSQHWRRDAVHLPETHRLPWSYSMGALGDEDFHIPPINPPTLPDHMLPPHLPHDSSTGPYRPLDSNSSGGGNSAPPHHPYQLQGMNRARMPASQEGASMLKQDGGTYSPDGSAMTNTLSVMQQMVNSDSRFTSSQQPIEAALGPKNPSGVNQAAQLSTINQTQLGLGGNSVTHNSPSPPGSKSATPSPSSSVHEDDNDDGFRQGNGGEKRPASFDISKKAKTPKKKKRKDPNEPVKPVSAYALFFRDTQANIKAQNPNATFGEVSKIVASMWDGLGEEQKQVYKKKTETAKKEYLKQLAAYRASLVSQSYNDPEMKPPPSSSSPSSSSSASMFTSKASVYEGPHPSSGSLAHQHPGIYMAYPHPSNLSHHPSSPSLGHPHLAPPHAQIHPQLHGLSSSGTVPRHSLPHPGALSLGGVVQASTPPHQVSPPLHSQAHLGGLHSPHHHHHQQQQQHQQLGAHSLGMTHSPAITQAYSLQPEYQPIGGGLMNSGGGVMSSSVDYHQLSRHMAGHHPSLDWSADYHGNGGPQRDKTLYQS
ncbi:thymocyte selection-associated high mobility group box protein TOX isoform X1 [Syngnathus typhle]|uniref:thymocyte selection-associated high mobility group box protein TOX isoform X1 n=1 Tax=Syngnathus typhle TaxID=161592 RepID=UPI002A6A77E6|nr:thymocyte selection-associated high mobility group box protein TOX isoform X1 [Syngnathus typhle]